MSAPGITPGPWQVSGVRHSGDLKLGRNARLHMVGPDGDAVAAVFYDTKTGVGWNDAKAIAAVPAMIAALQELLDIAHGTQDAGPEGEGWKSDELLASIAKAEEALKLAGVL